MKNESKILRGSSKLKTELIYDESEFSIQRNTSFYGACIAICPLLIIQLSLGIYNNINDFPLKTNPEKIWIYIYIVISIVLILASGSALFPFLKSRNKNNKVYQHNEVKRFEIQKIKNRVVLFLEITDGTKEKVKFANNVDIKPFIEHITTDAGRLLR